MFTEQQKQRISLRLGNIACPICGNKSIKFIDAPAQVMGYPKTPDGRYNSAKAAMTDCLSCQCLNCGYMMLFDTDIALK